MDSALILHLTHPVCLARAEARTQQHACLAGWTQKPRGRGRGSTSRSTRQSQEVSVLPAVLVSHIVGRSEIMDFGFCFLLPTEQGQVPAYRGPRRQQRQSLINQGTARWTSDLWGLGGDEHQNELQRPRKRVWMPQDPFTPGKTEREAGRECQWLWHTLFSAREDNGVASWFTTVALTHIVIRFCMQYQNRPLERRKNWKSLVLPSLFMQLGEVSFSYNAECLQHSSLAEAIVTAP